MRLQILLAAGLATLVSACNAAGSTQSVPLTNAGSSGTNLAQGVQPDVDMTSILKGLTKQSVVGSSVDPKNGDQNPHGLAFAANKPFGGGKLKKGDIVVCNYSDSSGVAGNGTSMEYMPGIASQTPLQLVANTKLKGCAGLLMNDFDGMYTMDSTAKNVVNVTAKGTLQQTITNKLIVEPWNGAYMTSFGYPPGDGIMATDPSSGKLLRIDLGSQKPKPPVTGVISGFPTNKGNPGAILGPSGVAFNQKTQELLYVVDGQNNTLYSFIHAYDDIQGTNAVVIGSDGKSFTGRQAKDAKVVYSGGQLKAPVGLAILPNGNLLVANSGNNMIVEIASNGKVLAAKKVDSGKAGALFGIAVSGTNDANTQVYFTDSNANNVQLLSK